MKNLRLFFLMLTALLCPSAFAQDEIEVDETKPLITDVSQLSSPWNAPHEYEGNIAHLLDDDPVTYWHTTWSKNVPGHYLQVELNEPAHGLTAMRVTRRLYNYNSEVLCTANHPTQWCVLGSDDPDAADGDWQELDHMVTPYNEPGEVVTAVFEPQGKQYLRFVVEANNSGNYYWHAAEFQLYPVLSIDELAIAKRDLADVYVQYIDYVEYFETNAGTEPGMYDEAAVAAFLAAMDAANAVDEPGAVFTAEELRGIIDNIKSTYAIARDSMIPLTVADGYYRLRSGMIFINNVPTGEVDEDGNAITEDREMEKYMYSVIEGEQIYARWHTPDNVDTDCPSLWKVTNKDGLLDIVNCATDARFNNVARSTAETMDPESKNLMALDIAGNVDGVPYVNIRVSTQNAKDFFYLHGAGHSSGAGVGGNIVGWEKTLNDGNCGASEWEFVPVGDEAAEAIIKAYEPYKNRAAMVESFKLIREDATAKLKIAKDLSVKLNEEKPYITSVDQLSSPWNAPHDWEGNIEHLLDNDPLTYWHTNWNKNTGLHYVQVTLEEPIHELVSVKCIRRLYKYNSTTPCTADHVTVWSIYGSDEPDAEDADWVKLAESATPYIAPGETVMTEPFDTQGKMNLRICAEATNSGNHYWHAAELQIYPGEIIDPATSQYHMMGAFGTTLNDLLEQLKDVDPEEVTMEQYDALRTAYEAFDAKFVNPAPLREKIAAVTGADALMALGTDPGFWKDMSASEQLNKVIQDAQAYDVAGKYSAEQSKAFIADLDAAAANIKASANPVQTGKWYRFRFGTEEEYAKYGWPTGGNEAQYRTVDGEATDAVINEANFGKYMAVAKLERVKDEDDAGEFTRNVISPLLKEEVEMGQELHFDDLEDLLDPDMALFRFIAVGDTAFILQNKATGLFLQKKVETNDGIYLSLEPSFFQQEVMGNGQNAFFIRTYANETQNPLHFARNTNVVITYGGYGDSDGRRGCFFVEEAEDVAADYAVNDTRFALWEGAMTPRCYPITVKATDDSQGGMWTVSSIEYVEAEDEEPGQLNVTLAPIADNVAVAGRPFIYLSNGEYTPSEDRDEGDEPELIEVTFGMDFVAAPLNEGALKGTFTRETVGTGVLDIREDKFARTASSTSTVNSNRAYIADEKAFPRGLEIQAIFDEGAQDGITSALQQLARTSDIFTLDGRLVKRGNLNSLRSAEPGIYIVNGVKVIVK